MQKIEQTFQISFSYDVYFTQDLFKANNNLLADLIQGKEKQAIAKILVIIDDGVAATHPQLTAEISHYAEIRASHIHLVCDPQVMQGGEKVKNDPRQVKKVLEAINKFGIDRHAHIITIGGGSILDMTGFAAAIAHRGIRHIRVPTTSLAQNDAGIGVKNGINQFGKKNFIGCFAPPFAVINDFAFLSTLEDRDWRSGITEAIKVALIKDKEFFNQIRHDANALAHRDAVSMEALIYRCARLHLDHIASGDPFEMGSSRPLDFGHWSAHKLEQLTAGHLKHGEAVAIGIALDSVYSQLRGMLPLSDLDKILTLFKKLGFKLFVPEMMSNTDTRPSQNPLFQGLEEFREHLGGQLTIMLLEGIGKGIEVNDIDVEIMHEAISALKRYDQSKNSPSYLTKQ